MNYKLEIVKRISPFRDNPEESIKTKIKSPKPKAKGTLILTCTPDKKLTFIHHAIERQSNTKYNQITEASNVKYAVA